MWLAFGFPNAKRERERGGRCGGEELERDVCMGVMELSLTHLLFSVVKTLCCLLALCFFDYYFFSKYIDIFFGETLRLLALLPWLLYQILFFLSLCLNFRTLNPTLSPFHPRDNRLPSHCFRPWHTDRNIFI